MAAGKLSSRWYQSLSVPGKPAYETGQRTLKAFGAGVRPPNVVVYHSSSGAVTKIPAVGAATARVATANPGANWWMPRWTSTLLRIPPREPLPEVAAAVEGA